MSISSVEMWPKSLVVEASIMPRREGSVTEGIVFVWDDVVFTEGIKTKEVPKSKWKISE